MSSEILEDGDAGIERQDVRADAELEELIRTRLPQSPRPLDVKSGPDFIVVRKGLDGMSVASVQPSEERSVETILRDLKFHLKYVLSTKNDTLNLHEPIQEGEELPIRAELIPHLVARNKLTSGAFLLPKLGVLMRFTKLTINGMVEIIKINGKDKTPTRQRVLDEVLAYLRDCNKRRF